MYIPSFVRSYHTFDSCVRRSNIVYTRVVEDFCRLGIRLMKLAPLVSNVRIV